MSPPTDRIVPVPAETITSSPATMLMPPAPVSTSTVLLPRRTTSRVAFRLIVPLFVVRSALALNVMSCAAMTVNPLSAAKSLWTVTSAPVLSRLIVPPVVSTPVSARVLPVVTEMLPSAVKMPPSLSTYAPPAVTLTAPAPVVSNLFSACRMTLPAALSVSAPPVVVTSAPLASVMAEPVEVMLTAPLPPVTSSFRRTSLPARAMPPVVAMLSAVRNPPAVKETSPLVLVSAPLFCMVMAPPAVTVTSPVPVVTVLLRVTASLVLASVMLPLWVVRRPASR